MSLDGYQLRKNTSKIMATLPGKFALFTFSLVGAYWTATRFQAGYCAPEGFWGLLKTPLMMASPLCLVTSEVISKSSQVYTATWIGAIGTGVTWVWAKCSELGGIKKSTKDD